MKKLIPIALLCLLFAGCASTSWNPLKWVYGRKAATVEKQEAKQSAGEDKAVTAAHVETIKTAEALKLAPVSPAVEVARRTNGNALALLNQRQPLNILAQSEAVSIVSGLLSEEASKRKDAEAAQTKAEGRNAALSIELEQVRNALDESRKSAKAEAANNLALANELRVERTVKWSAAAFSFLTGVAALYFKLSGGRAATALAEAIGSVESKHGAKLGSDGQGLLNEADDRITARALRDVEKGERHCSVELGVGSGLDGGSPGGSDALATGQRVGLLLLALGVGGVIGDGLNSGGAALRFGNRVEHRLGPGGIADVGGGPLGAEIGVILDAAGGDSGGDNGVGLGLLGGFNGGLGGGELSLEGLDAGSIVARGSVLGGEVGRELSHGGLLVDVDGANHFGLRQRLEQVLHVCTWTAGTTSSAQPTAGYFNKIDYYATAVWKTEALNDGSYIVLVGSRLKTYLMNLSDTASLASLQRTALSQKYVDMAFGNVMGQIGNCVLIEDPRYPILVRDTADTSVTAYYRDVGSTDDRTSYSNTGTTTVYDVMPVLGKGALTIGRMMRLRYDDELSDVGRIRELVASQTYGCKVTEFDNTTQTDTSRIGQNCGLAVAYSGTVTT